MNRRTLAETVTELARTVTDLAAAEQQPFKVRELVVALPIEVALLRTADVPIFLANAPRWRWASAFDAEPGRLHLTWAMRWEQPSPPEVLT